MNLPRWMVVVILGAIIAGGVAVDRVTDRDQASILASPATSANIVTAGTALSSAWYCAAGSAGGPHNHVVFITNVAEDDVTASISVFTDGSEPATADVVVPGGRTSQVKANDLVETGPAAVLVETPGDRVLVEHRIVGRAGVGSGPCSSTTSSEWYLPWGTTRKSATETIYIFNPQADAAVVNLTFETDDVDRDPNVYDGLVIAGRSVQSLDIGPEVNRRDLVAATVVALSGRVVVERVEELDGTEGIGGLALSSGAPAPAIEWIFADGGAPPPKGIESDTGEPVSAPADGAPPIDPTRVEAFAILNPSDRDAEVTVDVQAVGVEPFERTVRSDSVIVVETTTSSRVPLGARYGVTVTSANRVPVVVERVRYESDGSGLEAVIGRTAAAEWLVGGSVPANRGARRRLIVHNPASESLAELAVRVADEVTDYEIDPNGWDLFNVPDGPITITASRPVVAEVEIRGDDWVATSPLVSVMED